MYTSRNSPTALPVRASASGQLSLAKVALKGLAVVSSIFLLSSPLALKASGQTRKLQRAAFQSFSNPGGQQPLQHTNGLHLTEGYDRAPGTNTTAYNPGEPSLNMGLVRWESKKMPLKIWISPGLKLPEMPFSELQKVRPDQVYSMLCQPEGFTTLEKAPQWTDDTNYQVAAGIEQWRQFEREGLLRFGFVDDPKQAQVLVFFVDSFKDSTSPGGIMVGGNTCAQVYTYDQAQRVNIQQKPVVIELSTLVDSTPEKMIGASSHEFGHALGIKAHSPYRDDIMHENRIVNQLSPADKATFRNLYRSKPAYVM
ncbi:hypothetical protein BH11CYA1_BH11CYA1_04630 [soil metagenome]